MAELMSGQLLIAALVLGAIYGSVALGLNLIYGTMRLLNVAHGEILMLGGYFAYWSITLTGVGPIWSMFVAFLLAGLFGALVYHFLCRRVLSSSKLIEQIEATRVSEARFRKDVADANLRMAALEEEIRILDSQLGGVSQERRSLVMRLETQARIKEQFVRVETLFAPNEARVLQQTDRVILRLLGLGFASSSADLDGSAEPILSKVLEAIRIFPGSEIVVEGHTDASGGADTNLALSQERAESVTTWLSRTAGIPLRRFTTIGYGEARPVANNETPEGRARNRRIDVIILPTAGDG